jgi:hypothetical protein
MNKKSVLFILLILLNLPLLFATSSTDFEDGSSVVFLVDDFHSAMSNEISYDIKDYLTNRFLDCNLKNCESSISRQKWLLDSEINFNKNLDYLIIMPLSYYGLEKSLQSAVDKGINIIILENDVNFENATKILIPWQDAASDLLDYLASVEKNDAQFVEIQGNLMRTKSSNISTIFKDKLVSHNWSLYQIEENCPTRQLGFEKTLSFYRTSKEKESTYFFIHTMEASRGFLDARIIASQECSNLLSLDINNAIRKAILCDYCLAGVSYTRNYGERIISLMENEYMKNRTYYLNYEVVSKELLNE